MVPYGHFDPYKGLYNLDTFCDGPNNYYASYSLTRVVLMRPLAFETEKEVLRKPLYCCILDEQVNIRRRQQ